MKLILICILQVIVSTCIYSPEAEAAEESSCKHYVIEFQETVKKVPAAIYFGSTKIGQVDPLKDQSSNSKNVSICIDGGHSGTIEKNTVCYVSDDQIIVYNVWSTGIDLKEGDSIKGFTSRIGLFAYEAQEILVLLRDAVMAFAFEWIGKLAGEDSAVKTKKVYDLLVK
ncbi:hypothetical protein [Fundidesulfovibrio putealis]|uniref:hypothetical protein n=1 Tax=Fundidesulfovibrio putealis TaxID=270496 RepID=UPI0012EBC590|nr:hypothetical protein [Fundidesulfovibrio putealis]